MVRIIQFRVAWTIWYDMVQIDTDVNSNSLMWLQSSIEWILTGGRLIMRIRGDLIWLIHIQNDDDSLEDIFQNIRGIREQTPERPVLNYGLSGTDLDEQENTDEETPQQTGGRRRPFKSKYSIFYPKMCDPEPDENKNTSLKTNQKMNKNELGREATEAGFEKQAKTDNILLGKGYENSKDHIFETDKDQGSTNRLG